MGELATAWLDEANEASFNAFVAANVAPFAEDWDRQQRIPESALALIAGAGYLGCSVPREYGGQGWDTVSFGLLNEALGRGSCALADVLTVQAMVSMTLLKWGTREQKQKWLPPLASGKTIAAFAMTEPGAGSDLRSLSTTLAREGEHYVLNGAKRWISCGQFAGVFLVFAMHGQHSVACLVPRESAGLRIEPIDDLLGFRAAGLAELRFDAVAVPAANIVGKPGFALSHIAPVGLHFGRISTACSALGLLRGCFEESIARAATRRIGERTAGQIGMVRSMIARMGADLEAARLLCHDACRAEDEHLPAAYEKTLIAKYFTSRAATRAASDAVQICGASGCHASSAVSRYYRDAKILEIIEGTTQIHEDVLGKMFVDKAGRIAHER
jgi:alkylation response protein AidB-like acyl-CoA dehydrogenase